MNEWIELIMFQPALGLIMYIFGLFVAIFLSASVGLLLSFLGALLFVSYITDDDH